MLALSMAKAHVLQSWDTIRIRRGVCVCVCVSRMMIRFVSVVVLIKQSNCIVTVES